MTRWCPVCESPGKPVLRGSLSTDDIRSLRSGRAVRVSERLPGIEPTHFCIRCPTFFRGRDRFYLTVRREDGVHGIAVWPHRQARVRFEMGGNGLVALFADSSSVLIPGHDLNLVLGDFFSTPARREMVSWAQRRGFEIRLQPNGSRLATVRVDPPGPHFALLVVKSWAQAEDIRSADLLTLALECIGAEPVELAAQGVPS